MCNHLNVKREYVRGLPTDNSAQPGAEPVSHGRHSRGRGPLVGWEPSVGEGGGGRKDNSGSYPNQHLTHVETAAKIRAIIITGLNKLIQLYVLALKMALDADRA